MTIKLTKAQQRALAGGVFFVGTAIFLYVQFFWLPLTKEMDAVKTAAESVARDIESAQRQAARLPELDKQLAVLNERKRAAEQSLPRTKSVTDILVTLDALCGKHGVTLISFSPGPSKNQQYFVELKFPVAVRGSFHNIGKFFAALALEPRLYNVYNVNYPESDAATNEMQVTFDLVSYQYKEG